VEGAASACQRATEMKRYREDVYLGSRVPHRPKRALHSYIYGIFEVHTKATVKTCYNQRLIHKWHIDTRARRVLRALVAANATRRLKDARPPRPRR
jgi:hypothetical protein